MKKLLFFFLIAVLFSGKLSAQEKFYALDSTGRPLNGSSDSDPLYKFKAYDLGYELDKLTPDATGTHQFGQSIAAKIQLLENRYTSEVELVPGNPKTRIHIRKPVIYESVKRIDKYLRKGAKSGEIPVASATEVLNKVLDVALNVLSADTKQFEKSLTTSSDVSEKIELFTREVELQY